MPTTTTTPGPALRIDVDGTVTAVDVFDTDGGESGILRRLYAVIGCQYVEGASVPPDVVAYSDEQAFLTGSAPNVVASMVIAGAGTTGLPAGATIYRGPVVFAGVKGSRTVPLSTSAAERITSAVAAIVAAGA